jgi:hypothetical protein
MHYYHRYDQPSDCSYAVTIDVDDHGLFARSTTGVAVRVGIGPDLLQPGISETLHLSVGENLHTLKWDPETDTTTTTPIVLNEQAILTIYRPDQDVLDEDTEVFLDQRAEDPDDHEWFWQFPPLSWEVLRELLCEILLPCLAITEAVINPSPEAAARSRRAHTDIDRLLATYQP